MIEKIKKEIENSSFISGKYNDAVIPISYLFKILDKYNNQEKKPTIFIDTEEELEKSFNEIKEIVKSLEIELNFEKQQKEALERKLIRLATKKKNKWGGIYDRLSWYS